MRNSILLLAFTMITFSAKASGSIEESLYATGKIYVVVAVLLLIFFGIIGFLLHLERKISKLEKEIENK